MLRQGDGEAKEGIGIRVCFVLVVGEITMWREITGSDDGPRVSVTEEGIRSRTHSFFLPFPRFPPQPNLFFFFLSAALPSFSLSFF